MYSSSEPQQIVKHHWVHRRHEKGRCKSCGKSFQSKLTFGGNKEVVAVSCSWCKASYHNKAQCINEGTLTEACDFGNYAQIIVPPTWIVKLPRKGSFKSSIRRTPRNKRLSSKRRSKNKAADASSSSSCSLVVNSSASAAAVMAAASSSPNVLLVTGGGAGGQSSSERAKLSLNNGTLFSSSNNMGSSSGGGSSITIASSSLTSTSSPGSSPSPSSVILGLHQEGSGNGAGAGAGAASATLSVTPSPFLMGAHNGGNSSSGGGSSTTSPGGPSPSPPPLPPAPELPAHSFTPPPPPPSGSAHSHYYSKHNSGQISEMSGGPAHLYGAMVPSPMGVGGGGGGGVGGGGSRRQYRRHSHAAVSASSLTSSGLLSAEGKDGGGGGLPYGHSVSTSHYLQTVHRSFTIKPIPSPNLKPLLVFINPKSGGNQGAKLMQKFQWHLNPRQVFDLSQGGPRLGLDLYKKVHNLRVLACGGDGTAGWVLSTIDEIGIVPPPPIAVLPLGTGNDLARSINWGASYTDEPVSKILCNIQDGEVVQLDRWNLKVQRNPHVSAAHSSGEEAKGAKPDLPLNVVNNYFSIGVDAHIALSFHEAREAHPERFNSRFKNRIFYGQAGSKDLMQRKWKDLSNYVKLVCDGVDYTSRLKELKVHSVLFLNIPSYSGGTRPWAPSSSYDPQSTNDGQIEVIGLTTYQLLIESRKP
ncbi:hypothetical protein TYRP_014301 [Tyrophagus putrescentiae]|nr:hypothetical protein TYRP_014301 [Tyrophagus putrescentiae]